MADHHVSLVAEFAGAATGQVVRRVVRALQELRGDSLLSGPDSGLTNTWEEICVQVQGPQSFFWETYVSVIQQCVRPLVEKLPRREAAAIWLQTKQGEDWWVSLDEERSSREIPFSPDDVESYIVGEVLKSADVFSNERIRAYLGDE
jgi:hypothetical protein